jgi:hypothetical protein
VRIFFTFVGGRRRFEPLAPLAREREERDLWERLALDGESDPK